MQHFLFGDHYALTFLNSWNIKLNIIIRISYLYPKYALLHHLLCGCAIAQTTCIAELSVQNHHQHGLYGFTVF
jgi:hypothetical protein